MRINAEDPQNNFMPEGGKTVSVYHSPGGYGVRLDGFVYQGYTIPEAYDSLLVKLTVHGFTWEETVDRLRRCLKNYVIVGPKTTIPFYLNLVEEEDFQKDAKFKYKHRAVLVYGESEFDTSYLETHTGLMKYQDPATAVSKLAKLVAEIHHKCENPYAV